MKILADEPMRILSIETSCDDTGIAILETSSKRQETRFKVLSNIVSSQIDVHQQYGGVFPMMAVREHQKNLVPVLIESLTKAHLLKKKKEITVLDNGEPLKNIFTKEQELYRHVKEFLETYEKPLDHAQGKPAIDAIAITYGPGLEPCLWVGVNFARALSYFWNIPLIPVNHIEAHILVNFLEAKSYTLKAREIFPAISLVVSGGHTQLILVKGIGKYKIIGETRDDAAGECFDKAAKILGLGYPGGPIISKIASRVRGPTSRTLPRPMINTKDYDFSFSGLKTAVLYKVRDNQKNITDKKFVAEMCYEVQQSIIDVLLKKTLKAAKDFKARTIILGGGVSANLELRKQFKKRATYLRQGFGRQARDKIQVIFPEPKLSTDNGLMIAVAGFFNKTKKIAWQELSPNANLRI